VGQAHLRRLLGLLREHTAPVSLAIQTNGTLLKDKWLDFFDAEWPTIEIGVSLDGDTEGNRYRVDYADKPTTARIEAALRLLERRGRRVGVICVVTSSTIRGSVSKLLGYYAGFPAIKQLKFAPCFDYNATTRAWTKSNTPTLRVLNPSGVGRPGWAITPSEYADFLIEAFDRWRDEGYYRQYLIEPFTSIVQVLGGTTPTSCHFTEFKCAFVLTLYPGGAIGSCDELSVPQSLLGHVRNDVDLEALTRLQTNPQLEKSLNQLLAKCAQCSYRTTCGGGCLATRLRYQGTNYDDEYCSYRMRLIDHLAAATSRKA
jgi:radical SAM protein with 4Fe4S-binding SPASM domain